MCRLQYKYVSGTINNYFLLTFVLLRLINKYRSFNTYKDLSKILLQSLTKILL